MAVQPTAPREETDSAMGKKGVVPLPIILPSAHQYITLSPYPYWSSTIYMTIQNEHITTVQLNHDDTLFAIEVFFWKGRT